MQSVTSDLVTRVIFGALHEAVAATRQTHRFEVVAFVVLPDHLHTIWMLPPVADYAAANPPYGLRKGATTDSARAPQLLPHNWPSAQSRQNPVR